MPTITCMRGLPGSGKSTVARDLPGLVVCRDDLRMQMFGKYRGVDEDAVTVAERAMVDSLLRAGHDVVVDAMHLNPRYLRWWADLARRRGAKFAVHDVDTRIDECIARDFDRREEKSVGADVIQKLDRRFPKRPDIKLPEVPIEPYIPDTTKPPAIIVDIDGTLAHMTGRSPYDYSRVHEDTVDEVIRDIVEMFWDHDHQVLIVSGRDDTCYYETRAWMEDSHIPFDQHWQRPEQAVDNHGNKLPDWIVKLGIFNEHIRHNYNVRAVLDDRNQVVDMWRELGLKVLQVAPGDF